MIDPAIAINHTLDNEGGTFVGDDEGRGASKWGITLATARECCLGWTFDTIRNLTRDQAFGWYLAYWWPKTGCALLEDQDVANKVYDLGVNVGIGQATRLLQRVTGVNGDGILGPITAASVNQMDQSTVLYQLRMRAGNYYRNIAALNPNQAINLPGWLARLAKA